MGLIEELSPEYVIVRDKLRVVDVEKVMSSKGSLFSTLKIRRLCPPGMLANEAVNPQFPPVKSGAPGLVQYAESYMLTEPKLVCALPVLTTVEGRSAVVV